jgi:hypothetical protein
MEVVMRMKVSGLAALLVAWSLIGSRPVSAQGLASLAAASMATTAVEKTAGCWACGTTAGMATCMGGQVPGYYNCVTSVMGSCQVSSPGCGAGASLPVDLDGATQYVSRGSLLEIPVIHKEGEPPVRRNCEGVVVARTQSPDDIRSVRIRTGTLSL